MVNGKALLIINHFYVKDTQSSICDTVVQMVNIIINSKVRCSSGFIPI